MRLRSVAARLRGPLMIAVSAAAMAAAYLPADAAPRPTLQRIIAEPVEIPVFTPVTLSIPTLKVKAPIVPVGTEPDGKMGSPRTAKDVGWWAGRKAGKGNVLLAAHHDWNGTVGTFYRLGELEAGDIVIVKGSKKSKELRYRVVWVKNYDRDIDATELLGNKEKKQIATLITCGGTFDTIARTHRERVVARAELVTT